MLPYGVNVDAYVWFGILMTLLYALVLPALFIKAGIWAAEAGAARSGPAERRGNAADGPEGD